MAARISFLFFFNFQPRVVKPNQRERGAIYKGRKNRNPARIARPKRSACTYFSLWLEFRNFSSTGSKPNKTRSTQQAKEEKLKEKRKKNPSPSIAYY